MLTKSDKQELLAQCRALQRLCRGFGSVEDEPRADDGKWTSGGGSLSADEKPNPTWGVASEGIIKAGKNAGKEMWSVRHTASGHMHEDYWKLKPGDSFDKSKLEAIADKANAQENKVKESHAKLGVKVLHEDNAVGGSKYIDFDYDGQWYHVRFADHENTTQNPDRLYLNHLVGESIKKSSASGMDHPHEINVVAEKLPSSSIARLKLATKIIKSNPEVQKPDEQDGKKYGNSVTVNLKGNA